MVKLDLENEGYSLNVWGNGVTSKFTRIKFRKPKPRKLRWYLAIGAGALITAIAVVVVVTVVVHFTKHRNNKGDLEGQHRFIESIINNDAVTVPKKVLLTQNSPISSSYSTSIVVDLGNYPSSKLSDTSQLLYPSSGVSSISVLTASEEKMVTITAFIRQTISAKMITSAIEQESTNHPSTHLIQVMESSGISAHRSHALESSHISAYLSQMLESSSNSAYLSSDSVSSRLLEEQPISSVYFKSHPPLNFTESDKNYFNKISLKSDVDSFSSIISPILTIASSSSIVTLSNSVSLSPSSISSTDSVSSHSSSDISTTRASPIMLFTASTLSPDTTKLILDCEAINVMNWLDLQILRYHDDKLQTIAMVTSGFSVPSVSMFDPNFSSQISYKKDALAFFLESDHDYCAQDKNYTCIIRTPVQTQTQHLEVKVKQHQPTLKIPKAIVEGSVVTLHCSASVYAVNGTITWTFCPPGAQRFFKLGINPVASKSRANCTTILGSSLDFLPRSADNGSTFRCEVEGVGTEISEPLVADTTLLVIPSTYCSNKSLYTVHSHPYSPCNLVVYCFQTGPLVYEIGCDPGTCYDKDRTRCVPKDQVSGQ